MSNAFDVGISIHLIDRVSAALGMISGSFARTQTAAAALQARMAKIHSIFGSGLVLAGGGMALAAPFIMAANKAADLEEALKRVQVATRASDEEMQAFNQKLSSVANKTGIFSKPKLAEFAADMRSSGIMELKNINELIEPFAKGADAMKLLSKGKISPEESVHAFAALAHQNSIFDAKRMMPIIDAGVALAPSTPGGIETFKKWGSALVGVRNMNIGPEKQMAMISALSQTSGTGGTGRSGITATNLMNLFSRILPGNFGSGLLKGKSAFALRSYGLSDQYGDSTVMKNNKLNLDLLMEKLHKTTEMSTTNDGRVELAKLFQTQEKLLGKKAADMDPFFKHLVETGGKSASGAQLMAQLNQYAFGSAKGIATLLGDNAFQNQYKKLDKISENAKGTTERTQEELSHTTHFQEMRAATNMETLMSSFGMVMLPTLKKLFAFIGDTADKLNTFVELHPQIAQTIVAITAAAASLLIFAGVGRMLQAAFMGLQFMLGPVGAAVGFLTRALALVAPAGLRLVPLLLVSVPLLAGTAAAVSALILVITNWDKILLFAKQNVDWLKIALVVLIDATDLAIGAFKQLGAAIGGMLGSIGGMVNGVLSKLNIPNLPDFSKMFKPDGGMVDYANSRLKEKGLLTGIDKWAKDRPAPVASDQRFFMPPPINPAATAPGGGQAKQAPQTVTNTTTNNFNVQQVPGHDHEKCMKTMVKKAQHVTSSSSGGTVGRSQHTNGNYKP